MARRRTATLATAQSRSIRWKPAAPPVLRMSALYKYEWRHGRRVSIDLLVSIAFADAVTTRRNIFRQAVIRTCGRSNFRIKIESGPTVFIRGYSLAAISGS